MIFTFSLWGALVRIEGMTVAANIEGHSDE